MPSAWLSAVCSRSGARFVVMSYTQHNHTITATSTHHGERVARDCTADVAGAADAAPAIAADEPLVSIETPLGVRTLDKRLMLSGHPEVGSAVWGLRGVVVSCPF
jgi:hypothetical protein